MVKWSELYESSEIAKCESIDLCWKHWNSKQLVAEILAILAQKYKQ